MASDGPTTSATERAGPTVPGPFAGADFYATPEPVPTDAHGTLIRYEPVTPSVLDGATTYRIMYTSESLEGDPIVVTGTAIVPDTPAPAAGRPLLTIAHGTSGIADECAPSKDPGSELLLLAPAVADGWLIAETDYEGLGTPGRHPYLVGPSEGRGTIDAIVAAGALPDADPGDRLAIAGYSQGGHGALWANQVAAEWAPDLDVVGTFAGAPATEMQVILLGAPAGFTAMMIAGYAAAYPEADPATFLTPDALARLDAVDQGCTGDIFRAMADLPNDDISQPGAAASAPWKGLADANDPGRVATDDPVLIIHSDADDTVPEPLSKLLLDRMCSHGQVVERRILTGGENHIEGATVAYPEALTWLAQRFEPDAADPVDSCP